MDYRAIGIEAGYMGFPNDAYPVADLPYRLGNALRRDDEFRLDPSRDLLFFVNINDSKTLEMLRQFFPDGRERLTQSYQPEDSYWLFRVPAEGDGGWRAMMSSRAVARG